MSKDAAVGVEFAQEWIAAGPQIDPQYTSLWLAYGALQSERPAAMGGMMAIPFSSILRYAEHYDYTKRETDQLITVIRALDHTHMSVLAKRQEKSGAR
ncbi:MAG: phage tail assembly chaperone [Sphingobium sp.]